MSNFKVCKNGHHYQDTYVECPYCPAPAIDNAIQQQVADSSSANEKTQVFKQPAAQAQQGTAATGAPDKTQIMQGPVPVYQHAPPQPGAGAPMHTAATQHSGRKLVGWLVTFDNFPNGRDYKLYEGRNAIGFNHDSEVVIDFDNLISGRHLTILYRLGEFLFKDELSTNGTFINGVLSTEGALKDGDKIKIGSTAFLFRSALG